jgi:hypothetical protein
MELGDALTDTFAGATFSDRNVGIAKTVAVTGISTSGVHVGNYVLGIPRLRQSQI